MPSHPPLARLAAGTAIHVTATGIGLAAGTASLAGSLVAPPVRKARATAGAVAESGTYTATVLAQGRCSGCRSLRSPASTTPPTATWRGSPRPGKAMFEPRQARRSRRVWVSDGRAHLELAAPGGRG